MTTFQASGPVMGSPLPHRRTWRLLHGRGRYVADIKLPRMVHAVFLRSPLAHAAIAGIDFDEARRAPGVVGVFTGPDIARVCAPWRGSHGLYPALRAPLQHAMAVERARWSGEPVAMVVAASRAEAEDAAQLIVVDYEPLPVSVDAEAARAGRSAVIHDEFGTDIALETGVKSGPVDEIFATADLVVGETFTFGRHTGVPLEPRSIIADFEPSEARLIVHHSHQCPYQMQDIFARHLGLAEHKVRVLCPDVGGAFGIKQQLYGDEIAVCAASVLLGRPVAFLADRLESLASDIQAREHVATARVALTAEGKILAFDVDDLFSIGPYSQYPRSSAGEGRALLGLTGAPYAFEAVRVESTAVFQNKGMAGHYRGVGHPIACAVTEGLVEAAARRLGADPLELRRRNFVPPSALPYRSPTGTTHERLSFAECLEALERAIDIEALRRDCAAHSGGPTLRGLGFAAFVEQTSRGPGFYGTGGVRVSSRDACTVKLEPSGAIRCIASVTEQGQGVETGVAQVIATALGVPLETVEMVTGDSAVCFHGGGTWGSRSMAIGGEAAWRAASALRAEILALAGSLLQADPTTLDMEGGIVRDLATGAERISLPDLAALAHFRPHELPGRVQPQLIASATYGPLDRPFRAGCGIQLSQVEVDEETGIVTLLRHAVAHDCGRVVNPLLVDEQIRGGVAQGVGAALWEELLYGEDGQLLNGSLADYLVPMSGEMPDIDVIHVDVPFEDAEDLGIAGVGEAGTVGASAAVLNAINDALGRRGAQLYQIPCTPERVLTALGQLRPDRI